MKFKLGGFYDRNGRPIEDVVEWARAFEAEDRRVAVEELEDGIRVSTVFLGLDHRWGGDGPPLIYETMVFEPGSWMDVACERYSTVEEAREGHARMVEEYKERASMRRMVDGVGEREEGG